MSFEKHKEMIILKNQVNAIQHPNLYHWSHTFIRLALCGWRGVMHSYANIFELSQQSASFRLFCVSAHSLHPRTQLASVSLLTAELLEVIGNGRCFQVKEFTCIFGMKWCIQVYDHMPPKFLIRSHIPLKKLKNSYTLELAFLSELLWDPIRWYIFYPNFLQFHGPLASED